MTQEYIGVDLHKRFFQACAISVTGDRLWEQRFPRTADGISGSPPGSPATVRWPSRREARLGRLPMPSHRPAP